MFASNYLNNSLDSLVLNTYGSFAMMNYNNNSLRSHLQQGLNCKIQVADMSLLR